MSTLEQLQLAQEKFNEGEFQVIDDTGNITSEFKDEDLEQNTGETDRKPRVPEIEESGDNKLDLETEFEIEDPNQSEDAVQPPVANPPVVEVDPIAEATKQMEQRVQQQINDFIAKQERDKTLADKKSKLEAAKKQIEDYKKILPKAQAIAWNPGHERQADAQKWLIDEQTKFIENTQNIATLDAEVKQLETPIETTQVPAVQDMPAGPKHFMNKYGEQFNSDPYFQEQARKLELHYMKQYPDYANRPDVYDAIVQSIKNSGYEIRENSNNNGGLPEVQPVDLTNSQKTPIIENGYSVNSGSNPTTHTYQPAPKRGKATNAKPKGGSKTKLNSLEARLLNNSANALDGLDKDMIGSFKKIKAEIENGK